MVFPYVAAHCNQLETLKIWSVNLRGKGLEILSNSCHQLRFIELQYVENHSGLDKLIKVNKNLVSFKVLQDFSTSTLINGNVLEILGLYCPLLQICRIEVNVDHITDIQIETFTKGCPNLKELCLKYLSEIPSLNIYHKLLHSLGRYNPILEKLALYGGYDDDGHEEDITTNTMLTRQQCQSFQCLSNGCPLLKDIILCNCKLSTSDVHYLVNHSIHLEELVLNRCNICDDGLIITKEADKLKHLKLLDLPFNPNITDDSIINLIKGCLNLEEIDILVCTKLTDAALFSIADNCPNLTEILLNYDNIYQTVLGLIRLLKSCPKLVDIESCNEDIPDEIIDEIDARKKH